MKSTMWSFAAAFAVLFAMLISLPLAQAEDVNQDDVYLQRDNDRLRNEQVMNAQFPARGITCETGTCFKDTSPDVGFDQTPVIDPQGEAAKTDKSTKDKTKK